MIVVSEYVTVDGDSGLQQINLSLAGDGAGGGYEITVQPSVDLGAVSGDIKPDDVVRVTAIQIVASGFTDTKQTLIVSNSDTTDTSDNVESTRNFSNINTDIMSLTMYVNGTGKPVPVVIDFDNKEIFQQTFKNDTFHNEINSVCAWLTDSGQYTDENCSTANDTTNGTQTTCNCSHTTSFAVLVQVVEYEIPKTHDLVMTILSYFGISLSIFCLVIALFIFFSVQALRASERNMIHRNLMISLLLAYIVFLAGIEQATKIPIVCSMVAAIMHYLYLCVFAWMLIEGIHLYLMLVKVFGSEGSKRLYYMLVGWASPVIVVVVSVGIKYEDYGTKTYCWIKSGSPVIWAFVGPVVAIILFNLFVLLKVMHIIYRSSAISVDCPVDQIKAAAKGSLALLPLLGITWCLGLFAINQETLVFQYLFVICNSTQGILLFVFHVLFNSEVRNALKREQEKMGWSTAGTSQTNKNKSRVHPEIDGQSTMKAGFPSSNGDEKALVVSRQIKGTDEKKDKPAPQKTDSDYSLPGQIDEPIDEADTNTIRQEIKTEREMQKGGWKINEEKHVKRTFVRVEEAK